MRRKLYFGVALATFGIVVGGFTWTQTIDAQDAKKAEPEQKKSDQDLFDILRQKFEAKSDGPVLPPTKPMAPPLDLPLPTAQAPAPLPITTPGGALGPIPGPMAEPKPFGEKPKEVQLPVQQSVPPLGPLPSLPTPAPLPGPQVTPPPVQDLPKPAPITIQPKPAVVVDDPPTTGRFADPIGPTPMPLSEPIKLKGSAWSLYVEMVNGQTVVTATANKKHDFKIVCQGLDLQTGAGLMKAKGKVQISGDALNGSCDQLTLRLHDDRLVLEGSAEVRIQKVTANVSVARPAEFELKGDKLDLRISELPSSAYIETNWRKVGGDAGEGSAIPASIKPGADARWTTYGMLRNIKPDQPNLWRLESSDGETIAYLMVREGGSLAKYVGRTIAVFGAREGDRSGQPLLRVTHIALP